jgi:hypothetical protein
MDKRKNNGAKKGVNQGAGRKPKADEQSLIERLTPMEDLAHQKLKAAIEQGKDWAIKLYFDYRYGKPKQSTDVTSNGEQITVPHIVFTNAD